MMNARASARRRTQTGFSLTELMVAVTIGLIILAAVAGIFVNANKASNNQNRLARVQENGRFAMYYLLRDLRMTGYVGCQQDMKNQLTNDLATTTGFYFGTPSLAIPIEGIDDITSSSTPSWSPSGSTTLPGNVWNNADAAVAEPDAIAIRRVDTTTTQNLTAAMTSDSDDITVSYASKYQSSPLVLVADCIKTDLVQISGTTATQLQHGTTCASGITPCNGTDQLSKQYAPPAATVSAYVTRVYYIGLNNNNVPSLYRVDNGGSPVELVEGIESIKILYGIATPPNTEPSYYRKASLMSANDWTHVVSVKIGILAITPNKKDADIDNSTYDVNGTVLGPFNDHNSRRVFTATALLKDHILP